MGSVGGCDTGKTTIKVIQNQVFCSSQPTCLHVDYDRHLSVLLNPSSPLELSCITHLQRAAQVDISYAVTVFEIQSDIYYLLTSQTGNWSREYPKIGRSPTEGEASAQLVGVSPSSAFQGPPQY
jgi:hypothetical protein